ncbi:MAG: LPS assembly lipoprotein LptE [Chitinophagales bacterium]|nr:LPS assembly lipoprotein LptE [Chitinophagales bacterium]
MIKSKCLWFIVFLITLSSCKVYSFTGSSIPPEVKTMKINYFPNLASNAYAGLERNFNDRMRNQIISNTPLKLVEDAPDFELSGKIISYTISAQNSTVGTFTTTYRLDIGVEVTFIDYKTEKKTQWTQIFNGFEVYENDLSSIADATTRKISETISNQVFNKIFSTW